MPYWFWNNWDMETTEAANQLEEACLQSIPHYFQHS